MAVSRALLDKELQNFYAQLGDAIRKDGPIEPNIEEEEIPISKPPSKLNIRKNYVSPRVQLKTQLKKLYQVCPTCQEKIPVEEMEKHMKVELFSPKYLDQLNKTHNAAKPCYQENATLIAQNLKHFAERRTDIFGKDGEEVEIGKSLKGEVVNKNLDKIIPDAPEKVVWDGHKRSAVPTLKAKALMNTQIASLHARKGLAEPEVLTGASNGLPPNVQNRIAMKNPETLKPPAIPVTVPLIVPPPAILPIPMVPSPYPTFPTPSLPVNEPPTKKQKTDEPKFDLIPESNFVEKYRNQHQGLKISVNIQVPERQEQKEPWDKNLQGQILSINMSITDTVSALKEVINQKLEVPANKQKLKSNLVPVLKDQFTLAYYNLEGKEVLYLTIKERGGKKK